MYKYLLARFPNNPDSIEYYLNRPHKVKLFDYEQGTIEREMSTMDSIRYMVHFMHCSFVAMEPQTGAVKAWVGDIDFKSWKYDKVTAMRQPGSTFKLFVYTEAMNQGLTPCDKRRDEYFSMKVFDKAQNKEVTWAPTNANGYFTGDSIPLKAAFARSINSVAVRLGQEMGITRIAETAHKMGIESPLDETPALALGSSDINPKNSLRRRNIVLSNMVRHGDLTRAEYDSISQIDIELKYSVESNYDGTALYFREAVADELRKWCNDNDYDLYTSGLKIYTTIDSRMQKYAEEAAIKQMKQVQRNFN